MEIVFNQTNKHYSEGQRLIRKTFISPIITIEEDVIPEGCIKVTCYANETQVTTILDNNWAYSEGAIFCKIIFLFIFSISQILERMCVH